MDAVLLVESFSAVKPYDGTAMIVKESRFVHTELSSARWDTSPADMIADRLVRNLGESGIFRAVFSSREFEEGHFALVGEVEEFLLAVAEGKQAVLSVRATLIRIGESYPDRRVIMQKTYRIAEHLSRPEPAGLAESMSSAMAFLSAGLIEDIARALGKEGLKTGRSTGVTPLSP